MSFADLGLSEGVLRAVESAGYAEPTPIQQQAIPHVLTGRDVLGRAQTGTGKTAAFILPMIEHLAVGRARARMPRSLILTPTRELAGQIAEHFDLFGKEQNLDTALLIGGVRGNDQSRLLERGVDILIATPGRFLDHMENGRILLNDIKILVIDEADRMLDMGFIPDVERIVRLLPRIRQTLFFSATLPPEIRKLADAFLINPKEVSVDPPATPAATVEQRLCIVHANDKREALRRIVRSEDVRNALVFCNRKRDVDLLFRSLKRHGLSVAALHGDMDQASRTETLGAFKDGKVTLLVASDVAARGLDIADLSHVFNFDVPIHSEDYVHRIGRTGRAGKTGRSFTLATPADTPYVEAIIKLIGEDIPHHAIDGMGKPDPEQTTRTRRSRSGRPVHSARPAAKVPARQRRDSALPRKPAGEPVVGMGDHVPAFLRRPRTGK